MTHEQDSADQNLVFRVPKPNLQIIVLGLVAIITLFQTFQLVRISTQASSALVKAPIPATATTTTPSSGSSGTGSNTAVPQSQVGGC